MNCPIPVIIHVLKIFMSIFNFSIHVSLGVYGLYILKTEDLDPLAFPVDLSSSIGTCDEAKVGLTGRGLNGIVPGI